MPTIPFRPVSDIEHDIPVCTPDKDLCQLRINDEGRVACYESLFFHTTSAFAATHNLSLEQYNSGVNLGHLTSQYNDVCRSEYVDTSDQDGRFELFSYRIMNRSDVREEVQGILGAVAGNAAAGEGLPSVSDPNHFPTCIAEASDSNGAKTETIWLTAAEAEYLSSKFTSHDRMLGCLVEGHEPGVEGQTQFWITNNPETLGGLNEDRLHFSNGVIDRINEDIRNRRVPEGVRAREIVNSLINIREANPYVSGVRSQVSSDAAVESNYWLAWKTTIFSTLVMVGYFAYQGSIKPWLDKRKKTSLPVEDYTDTMHRRMDAEQYRIRGWDSEAEWALKTLKSARFPNLLIDAPTQWGKDIILDRMIQYKVERSPLFPPYFLDAPVRQMVLTDFVADTGVQGNIGDKVKVMIDAARRGPVIFLISEIDKLLLFGVPQHAAGGRVTLSPEAPAFQLMNAYNNPVIRKNLAIWGSSSRYPELVQMINDLIGRFNQLKLTEQKHLMEVIDSVETGFPKTEMERNNQVTISKEIIRDAAILAERYYRPFRTTPDEHTGKPIVCARFPAVDDIMRDAARIAQERLIAEKVAQANGHGNPIAAQNESQPETPPAPEPQSAEAPAQEGWQQIGHILSQKFPRLSGALRFFGRSIVAPFRLIGRSINGLDWLIHRRWRSRVSTTTEAQATARNAEPLGAVTTEDVIKAVEGRIRRSLNRAEVNAVLALPDSDLPFIEIPDNPTDEIDPRINEVMEKIARHIEQERSAGARGPVPADRQAIEPGPSGSSAADSSSDGTSGAPPRERGPRGGPAGRFTEVTMNEFFRPQGARTQETTYPAPAVCETVTNDTATRVAQSNAPAPTFADATRFGLLFGGAMTAFTELYKATFLGNRRDVNEVESTTIMVGTGAALDSVMGNELTWGSLGRLAQGFVEFLPAFFMTGISNSRAAQAARTTEGAGVVGVANIASGAAVTAAGSEAASQVAATTARQAIVTEAAGAQTMAPAATRVLTSTPAMGLWFSLFYDRGMALGTAGDTFWGDTLGLCTSDGTDCTVSGWGAEKLHTVVDPVVTAANEYVIAPVSAGVGAATAFVGNTARSWYEYDTDLLGIREYTDAAGRQLEEWYEYDSQLLKDAGEAVTGAINYVGNKANEGFQWAGNKVGQGLEAANDAGIGVLDSAAEFLTGGEYEYDPTWWDIF